MNKIVILFFFLILLLNCSGQEKDLKVSADRNVNDKNELLIEAYGNNDYEECLEILQSGADGRIDYLKPNYPILFDICQKYLDSSKRSREIEELLNFYLKNRKDAFEDSISGIYSKQTVGSYLIRFASIELLQQIVKEKININSPDEKSCNSAIYELSMIDRGYPIRSDFFKDLKISDAEKIIRLELLLNAGSDVTLTNDETGATIFHFFSWWPMEENYTDLLDRMIENGADLFKKSKNGYSCIYYMVNDFALDKNTEAYLEYVISRGLEVTKEDLGQFNSKWSRYMRSNEVTEIELSRLMKIKKLLEDNLRS